jgi:hypothetical protein
MDQSKIINEICNNKKILVDSNFILNALRHPEIFDDILKEIKSELVTIEPVKIEIYKGSDTYSHVQEKTDFFNSYISETLEMDESIIYNTKSIAVMHRKNGGQHELTDLLLSAFLKQNSESLILITSNFKDFPLDIFDWLEVIPLPHNRNQLINIVLIKFNQNKFEDKLDNFLKTKKS